MPTKFLIDCAALCMKLGSNSIIINIVTKVSDVDIRVPVNIFLPLLVMITLIDDDIIITLRIIVNSIVNLMLPPYCIYIIIYHKYVYCNTLFNFFLDLC